MIIQATTKLKTRVRLESWLSCLLMILFFATNANAQRATASGTQIENQAVISYTAPDGRNYSAVSNVASTVIRSIYAINLIPDAGNNISNTTNFNLPVAPSNQRIGNPGSSATLVYTLENLGNTTDTITLTTMQDPTDDYNLENIQLFKDANGNAIFDPSEPIILAPIILKSAEKINIFVVGTIPTTAANNAVARVELEARSSQPSIWDNNNLGSITVVRDAAPTLAKSATEPDLNGFIKYQIVGSNIGQRAARSLSQVVRVDGNPLDGILLTDTLPAGTALELNQPILASTGTAYGSLIIYRTGTTWSAISNPRAEAIGLLLRDSNTSDNTPEDLLNIGSSFTFSFVVRVLESVEGGTRIRNVAQLEYGNSNDLSRRVLSNETISSVFERSNISIMPKDRLVTGAYTWTEPTTGRIWTIARSGEEQNRTDKQSLANIPGGISLSFINTIRNTGNISDTFSIDLDPSSQLENATIQFLDETMQNNRNNVRLAPGQEVNLIVRINLPISYSRVSAIVRVKASLSTISDISTNEVLSASSAGIWIGPLDNPTITEYPDPADSQSQEAFVGASVRYEQTVLNASSFTDTLELSLETPLPNGWTVRFLNPDNTALPDTNNNGLPELNQMPANTSKNIIVQVTPPINTTGNNQGNGWRAVVKVQSTFAPRLENRTLNILSRIRTSSDGFSLVKTVSTERAMQGTTLEFTLTWQNTSGTIQNNLVITDTLNTFLDTPSNISNNGTFDPITRNITWRFASVGIGESQTLRFSSRVRNDTPDLERILNTAQLITSKVVTPLASNTTQTDILGSILQLEKRAKQSVVSIGGVIDYELRVRNASKNAVLENLTLTDVMPIGVTYKLGSSRIGNTAQEPSISIQNGVQVLTWKIGKLPAKTTFLISLQGIVTPNAPSVVENMAVATAIGGTNKITVNSNNAIAAVQIQSGIFGRASAILGRVYFDQNKNRIFDNNDYPIANTRIYLSNGSYSITDKQGRYSFPQMQPGYYALRLDPMTTPWTMLTMPGDTETGTRHVQINDPAPQQIDFPMLPPEASIEKTRRTTLTMGSINLEKQISAGGAGYTATLTLTLTTRVANLRLTDPIPNNAVRQQLEIISANGQVIPYSLATDDGAIKIAKLEAGKYLIRYAFFSSLSPESALTDPDLYWDEVQP
jgi:uncharacterized repeat protein (TIGR01451 family)